MTEEMIEFEVYGPRFLLREKGKPDRSLTEFVRERCPDAPESVLPYVVAATAAVCLAYAGWQKLFGRD